MQKLISISKRLDLFFKVVQKLILVLVSILLVVTTVVSLGLVGSVISYDQERFMLDIGPLTVELSEAYAPGKEQVIFHIWAIVLMVLLLSGLSHYAFGLMRKVLQPMTEGRPFAQDINRPIKKLAFAFLVLGIVQNIGIVIETSIVSNIVGKIDLTHIEGIWAVTTNYSFELGFFILFFVFLLLAHVFKYGAELQQLSDETL